MNRVLATVFAIFAVPLFAEEGVVAEAVPLFEQMAQLDASVFESFNHCDNPEELARHASYFSADVEFYHDTGGVSWDRATMIANTKQYACGNFTRQLVAETFSVSPIKDFGAITKGEHIFCQTKTQACEGKADFVMVWKNTDGDWQITRVLSFGHRENK